MRSLAVLVLLAGCRIALESEMTYQSADDSGGSRACQVQTNTACMNAVGHSDFTFINTNILNTNCGGSSCHQANSTSAAKNNPYSPDKNVSYASLVNFDSKVQPGVKLVVAGQLNQSYMLVMLQDLKASDFNPPTSGPGSDPGFMPQGNKPLCCQKLDAIEAWITAGAMND